MAWVIFDIATSNVQRIEFGALRPDGVNVKEVQGITAWPVATSADLILRLVNDVLVWADPRTLAQTKDAKWAAMKKARDSALNGSFASGGLSYNCNRDAINTAAIGALLAKAALDITWSKVWTLADNTSATLTADQMLAVARACDNYITSLWATGRALQAQIDAATTIAAVDAITWP